MYRNIINYNMKDERKHEEQLGGKRTLFHTLMYYYYIHENSKAFTFEIMREKYTFKVELVYFVK